MKIYHQLGHNYSWNLKSFEEDSVGEGLIISPVNISPNKISKVCLGNSFFDPQCYKIDSEIKESLEKYEYFIPQLKEGLHSNVLNSNSATIVENCLKFQNDYNFKYNVIPTMYSETDLSYTLSRLSTLFVKPFLNQNKKLNLKKKILLTVIIKNTYIESNDLANYLLNWITSFPEIDGVYLIPDTPYEEPISNSNFIFNFLKFIQNLKSTGLEVHIGYSGIEGIIYSIAMPDSISVGVYKNLRSFSVDRFKKEQIEKRAPHPRVFSYKLLYWERFDDALLICNSRKKEDYFDFTKYNLKNFFPLGKKPHFSNSLLYLHYFYSYNEIVKALPANQVDRIKYIDNYLENSLNYSKCLGSNDEKYIHLKNWKMVLKIFEEKLNKKEI